LFVLQLKMLLKVWYDVCCDKRNYQRDNPGSRQKAKFKILDQWFSTFHGLWSLSIDCQHLWPRAHQ